MKQKLIPLPGLLVMLLAAATPLRAQFTLFEESFESGNLTQWFGKPGLPHHGQIVADPLNAANRVLTFTAVNAAGDIFSASTISVDGLPRRYVLSFDFLGLAAGGMSPSEYGGFAGVTTDPAGVRPHYWLAGTFPQALNVPSSVATALTADGLWHHYEIDFTEVVVANEISRFQLMLEDWFDRGSLPGDVYFDNVRLAAPIDFEQLVPCAGPLSGGSWKNHGQYVSSVAAAAEALLAAGAITDSDKNAIVRAAAQSDCGHRVIQTKAVQGNVNLEEKPARNVALKAQAVPAKAPSIPRYELRDLGRRFGPNVSSGVATINNSGLMAGYVDSDNEKIGAPPYLFSHGRIRRIPLLTGYMRGSVWDINESGDAVGINVNEADLSTAFLYTRGRLYDLSNLLQYPIVGSIAINNNRWLVGTARLEENGVNFGFFYRDGAMTILPSLLPCGDSFALDINDAGEIIGSAQTAEPVEPDEGPTYHAVIYSGTNIIDLGALPGADFSIGRGINEAGHAIGWSRTAFPVQTHAFLYRDGVMEDLGTLPGDVTSLANGMNNDDLVVGSSVEKGTHYRAVLFAQGKVYDLNTLLASPSDLFLEQAMDINDLGVITCIARAGAQTRAVVLTPVKSLE